MHKFDSRDTCASRNQTCNKKHNKLTDVMDGKSDGQHRSDPQVSVCFSGDKLKKGDKVSDILTQTLKSNTHMVHVIIVMITRAENKPKAFTNSVTIVTSTV